MNIYIKIYICSIWTYYLLPYCTVLCKSLPVSYGDDDDEDDDDNNDNGDDIY